MKREGNGEKDRLLKMNTTNATVQKTKQKQKTRQKKVHSFAEQPSNYISNLLWANHRQTSKVQGHGLCWLMASWQLTEHNTHTLFLSHTQASPQCLFGRNTLCKSVFVCVCVCVWVKRWVGKKERNQRKCECEWVAIDGGVNRRLTTEGWKTLGEALWRVRRVNQATSTGKLGPCLSFHLSFSLTRSAGLPTKHCCLYSCWFPLAFKG